MEELKKHIDVIAEEAKKVFKNYNQVSKIIIDEAGKFLTVRLEIKDLDEKGDSNE